MCRGATQHQKKFHDERAILALIKYFTYLKKGKIYEKYIKDKTLA
jgi:hypothetical protein